MNKIKFLNQQFEFDMHDKPLSVKDIIPKMLSRYASMLLEERFAGNCELLCCLNMSGYFRYICPNHKEHMGFESHELVGANVFDMLHQDDIRKMSVLVTEMTEKKRPMEVNYRIQHKNGDWVTMNTIATPFLVDSELVALVNFSNRSPLLMGSPVSLNKNLIKKQG